jgi:hypothetical protein
MTLLFMFRGRLLLVLLEAPTLPSTIMTSVMFANTVEKTKSENEP